MKHLTKFAVAASLLCAAPAAAQTQTAFPASVESSIQSVLPRMIAWRRDFHEHPELSYEEVRTARVVAQHLRSLRMEVRTNVAQTGVVGVLRGARPGPVIALRADMDALPVTEEVDLPFASRVRATYNGQNVGVMHACGHDTHVAVLMAAAQVLAGRRNELAGTVIFVFQPSEEGAPPGGLGGARRMIAEDLFGDLEPEAIFGLHAWPIRSGAVSIASGPTMAGSDRLRITVHGSQTHGAQPHRGVDPIVVSSQIVNALQTIPSRQMDAVRSPVIVTIGSIHGGVRYNIIPDSVQMEGTIRYLNPETRDELYARIRRTAEEIAASAGARADISIEPNAIPVVNPAESTARARAALVRALGEENVLTDQPNMVAEDFAYFQQELPGVFFFYGVNAPGVETADAAPNHSPRFFVHEPAMETALRAMLAVALDRVAPSP
ncbi:MAG TPA: amidohydrolase [Vitreimonas sp.]|uniref:amidohydrolase n=1 Tax=Vitreimonas sp. TaxID=3069702 RepID=UPI002D3C1495|nr:amidohydrolase [Vitreimonas sp.]HYD87592.1 amidohydrolase [Vitreimonas sp.]